MPSKNVTSYPTPEQWRAKMLASGVKSLREYGYPSVTTENLLSDRIYSAFFSKDLEDLIKAVESQPKTSQVPAEIAKQMLAEIAKHDAAREAADAAKRPVKKKTKK